MTLRYRHAAACIAAAAIAVASLLLGARPALAHAIVQSTQPRIDEVVDAPPERIVMRFNEPVEITFGSIRVFDTNGDRVDTGEADHLPGEPDTIAVPLEPDLVIGTYTVTWRVVSADGHAIAEAFVFHVGEPGENPEGIASQILRGEQRAERFTAIIFAVARWVTFAALLVFCGALAFVVLIWRRASADAAVRRAFARRWGAAALVAWAVALVGSLAGIVLQGAVAAQVSIAEAFAPTVVGEVVGTRFGTMALARVLFLSLLLGVWFTWKRALAPGDEWSASPPAWLVVATAALGLAALATPGLAGHAGTSSPAVAGVAADTAHMAAAATWFGGLVLLLVGVFPATRRLAERERVRVLAPMIGRFSDVALVAVAIIIVTGVYRSWQEVGGLAALRGSTYGSILLIKLGVFLPALVLGAINNRWTKPRLRRAAAGDEASAPLAALRRLLGAEVGLILVVLALTAFLVNLPPAKVATTTSGPFVADVRLGDHNLDVLVDPNEVGENEVHLTVTTPAGAPVHVKDMRVLFRMPEQQIGPLVGKGTELAHGHFVVQGRQLSVPGEWQLEIVARMGRFEEERATVRVQVNR